MNDLAPITAESFGLARYDAACAAIAAAKSVDEVKEVLDEAEQFRFYAKQAKNKQLEIDASEIRFRAERRLGELMAAQKATVGLAKPPGANQYMGRVALGPEAPPTLAEAGIGKHLADRARKYAAIPAKDFEGILSERRGRIEQEDARVTVDLLAASDKHVRGTLGTGENEWYTPVEHLDLARYVLGEIDLDPASSERAQATVRAARFFTEADNGLTKDWEGNVWLNPPYAQPAIADFADKMVAEWQSGRVTGALMLTHNYTDTAWFQKLARAATAICFTRGRVRFVSPAGDLASPTQGQAFFYFGTDLPMFAAVFDDVGFVVVREDLLSQFSPR